MRFVLLLALLTTPVIAAEEAHGEASEPSEVWKWANFLILAGGLGYLISKNAGAFFAGRDTEIKSQLIEARKLREEADARIAEIERRISNLGTEVEALRTASKAEMNVEAERIRQETLRAIERVQASASQEIAFAAKLAQRELKVFSASLALQLASQQIRERLTPAKQDELTGRFVSELAGTQKVSH